MMTKNATSRSSQIFKPEMGTDEVTRVFLDRAKRIQRQWKNSTAQREPNANRPQNRISSSVAGPTTSAFQETPKDRMTRKAYRLIRSLCTAGHVGILSSLISEAGKRHRGRHSIDDKPFQQAILIMFGNLRADKKTPLLNDKRRSDLAMQMEYAFKHGVASKYVNGFIKQAGQRQIPAKLKAGYWEPGFNKQSGPQETPTSESKRTRRK